MDKKKIAKTAGRIALISLIAILIGVSIYNLNAKALLGEQLPMPFGIGASVVLSGSMEPELSVNDLIIVKKTEEVRLEQVVVYQSGSSLTVHRIKSIEGDVIITKGDGNNAYDEPISPEQIKGEVIYVIPYVGVIVNIIQHPVTVIIILAAAVFLFERSFRQEKKKDSEELERIKQEIERLSSDKSDS